jgi:hypothetical protein
LISDPAMHRRDNTPEQFAAVQQRESARWKQVIETRKITAD